MRDSGWSGDRMPRNRIMLIALPLIVTMAVGLIVGIRLVSEKNATLRLSNTGQGTANSTPATPALPATSPPAASPSMTPSPTAPATATPAATATDMSCVRSTLPAPSQLPPTAAGCAGASPGRNVVVPGAGAVSAAAGAAAGENAGPAARTAAAGDSAVTAALRLGASRTAAARGE
jgi:rare lipoprotein A